MIAIIYKCGVRGDATLCVVIFCYCKCYPKFRNYLKVRRERKVG